MRGSWNSVTGGGQGLEIQPGEIRKKGRQPFKQGFKKLSGVNNSFLSERFSDHGQTGADKVVAEGEKQDRKAAPYGAGKEEDNGKDY